MKDQSAIATNTSKSSKDKSINSFLGFIEGIVMDGAINSKEADVLVTWNEDHPDVLSEPPFNTILPLLEKFAESKRLSDDFVSGFSAYLNICRSTKYYDSETADIQRLHGMLAGIICDGNISRDELIALNQWMKKNDHLEDNSLFQEIYALLRPIRTKKDFSESDTAKLAKEIRKYVDVDNGFRQRSVVSADSNPDFYHGALKIQGGKYCFTGASSRFSKKQWKDLVESNGALFVDDMTNTVDYLVVCNKGNSAWAHVSYGRKFEQAKKMQAAGGAIQILTEDDFIAAIDANGLFSKA